MVLLRLPLFFLTRTGRFRDDFDSWIERERIAVRVKAEIEDMALLRLFALSGEGLALVYEIVVQREPAETFFAVTTSRKFRNARIERLVRAFARSQS